MHVRMSEQAVVNALMKQGGIAPWWGCTSSIQLTHSSKGAWFQLLNL
jgi:hypothetical protein